MNVYFELAFVVCFLISLLFGLKILEINFERTDEELKRRNSLFGALKKTIIKRKSR